MDFQLNEQQVLVRDMAQSFAEQELLPRATKMDRQGFIDPEVFEKMGELGLWGLTIPESYGGAGMGNVELAIVLEEINRACASTGVTLSVHNSLLGSPIMRFGTRGAEAAAGCPSSPAASASAPTA